MLKARVYDFSLFFISLALAFFTDRIYIGTSVYVKSFLLFWFFSLLYHHLRVIYKNGSMNFDYGISYSLTFAILAGPKGLFIYEAVLRFSIFVYKKWRKAADPEEFLDMFYNIGSFVLSNSIVFYLYHYLHSYFALIPFGFWILMILLSCIFSTLSSTFLTLVFFILGEIKSAKEGFDFIFKSTSLLDYGKTGLTNALLLLFVQEEQWGMLLAFFVLNYIVNRSFYYKSQSIQDKNERDKFEQMAYTDFLTGVFNRTFMDKKMAELNETGENIGIVVADIDKFKRINDTYNHAVGDKVIQHFAATLKSYLNEDDFLFRSGGEEFTLCLRKRNFDQTEDLVSTMLKGIRSSSVDVEYNGETVSISYSASFGLYYYKVNDHFSMEKGYILADELMLHSKELGRGKVSALNGKLAAGVTSV